MIRVILLGRTGNILFQYALGRVLAGKHGVPLILDASWYNDEGWREISHLLRLKIRARVVRRCSIGMRALRKLTGKHYWEYAGKPVIREPVEDQSFNPQILESPRDCVLFGYFQTPLYFHEIAEELRQELNDLIAPQVQSIFGRHPISEITRPDSVAVHVRRGDYLKHPGFSVCDRAYYSEAMTQMRSLVPGARFFIFSDDVMWCRDAFRGEQATIIDSGKHAANPLHDLHLMSLASHHIIANSSYSWWAAWLGAKPAQQVIMPERWYASDIKAPIDEKRWSLR